MPPLALVVGAHDQQDVFDRYDQDQCPHNQRQDAEHVFRLEREPVLRVEALSEGIDRARADIAEHNTERRDGKPAESGRGCWPLALFVGACRGVPSRDDLGRRGGLRGWFRHTVLLAVVPERSAVLARVIYEGYRVPHQFAKRRTLAIHQLFRERAPAGGTLASTV